MIGGGDALSELAQVSRVSFVIVLWFEPQVEGADPEWRWRVRHLQSGEQAYFRTVADVLAFVASRSGCQAPK